jgi:hypothetical protein
LKREWLKWENIASICEKVAEELDLEFTGFSDAITFYCDPYYYERYYAYFKKKDSDIKIRVAVVEIVADSEAIENSEVAVVRIAAESYIEEQLKKMVMGTWSGELANRLREGNLTDRDIELLKELALASGWDEEDKARELLGMIDYAELYRKYLREAYELKKKGDFANAGKKLWGAITALLKEALSGVPHDMDEWIEWSRLIINKYIIKYGGELRDVLEELLDRAWSLYDFSMRFCYDADVDVFEHLWERVIESLQKTNILKQVG